jgi:hypothetical protein
MKSNSPQANFVTTRKNTVWYTVPILPRNNGKTFHEFFLYVGSRS